jgi:hypothetical protein
MRLGSTAIAREPTPSASPSTNLSNPLKMVITSDGGTIFIAGDQQIIVLPVP